MNIPFFGLKRQYRNLKDELLDATHQALKDGQLMSGKFTRAFEQWLCEKNKTEYAVTVHSGTQALEIIAKYKRLQHTDSDKPTVNLPNITYPATINAFVNAGFNVVLRDTDLYGIMKRDHGDGLYYTCLVGLYGMHPWPQDILRDAHNVIIDGAQHWLVSHGQVGCGMAISFDPTKNLNASGNGGAIVTNDRKLYKFASLYKDNGKPFFEDYGTNTKLSEQECAHLLVRAKYIDQWQERRKKISEYWCESFKHLPIRCLADVKTPHCYHKFVIYLSDRNSLHTNLLLNGIESKKHYEYTLGDLPIAESYSKPDLLSNSVMLSRGVLSLPIYPELTDTEVEYIKNEVNRFFSE